MREAWAVRTQLNNADIQPGDRVYHLDGSRGIALANLFGVQAGRDYLGVWRVPVRWVTGPQAGDVPASTNARSSP